VFRLTRSRLKIAETVKTLILEFLEGNGPGNIRKIHLQVISFRPEVPQHTVSQVARDEPQRQSRREAVSLRSGFYGLYEDDPDLCGVVSCPDRGPWADSRYRGNCSGHLVKDLILRFGGQSVSDPAEGSGTVRDVVAGINQYRHRDIRYEGRDLRGG
jgi:hypothetical protein